MKTSLYFLCEVAFNTTTKQIEVNLRAPEGTELVLHTTFITLVKETVQQVIYN